MADYNLQNTGADIDNANAWALKYKGVDLTTIQKNIVANTAAINKKQNKLTEYTETQGQNVIIGNDDNNITIDEQNDQVQMNAGGGYVRIKDDNILFQGLKFMFNGVEFTPTTTETADYISADVIALGDTTGNEELYVRTFMPAFKAGDLVKVGTWRNSRNRYRTKDETTGVVTSKYARVKGWRNADYIHLSLTTTPITRNISGRTEYLYLLTSSTAGSLKDQIKKLHEGGTTAYSKLPGSKKAIRIFRDGKPITAWLNMRVVKLADKSGVYHYYYGLW